MKTLNKLKHYFKNNHIEKTITINGCEKIENVNKTADSLIYLLECREGNTGYDAYLKTLNEIYEKARATTKVNR